MKNGKVNLKAMALRLKREWRRVMDDTSLSYERRAVILAALEKAIRVVEEGA